MLLRPAYEATTVLGRALRGILITKLLIVKFLHPLMTLIVRTLVFVAFSVAVMVFSELG